MPRIAPSLLVAAALAATGCQQPAGTSDIERPAPPGQFAAATSAGVRLTGAAARIDIRYVDLAGPPAVEVMFSAAGGAGETWSVQALAPADFLETKVLTARVVDGRLQPGTATVQLRRTTEEMTSATTGLLSLRLHDGRLSGDTSRMANELSATFEGPFVVTCSVPATSLAAGGPAATGASPAPTLVVDETFATASCQPFANLGGWAR